jgi:hypothetical protein
VTSPETLRLAAAPPGLTRPKGGGRGGHAGLAAGGGQRDPPAPPKIARPTGAGGEAVDLEPLARTAARTPAQFLDREGLDAAAIAPLVDGKFMSAFVRARKPPA